MTTTQHTARLVNCQVAYLVTNRYGQHIETQMGAYGVPEQAMELARTIDRYEADGITHEVVGVQITDVRTGEKWMWVL